MSTPSSAESSPVILNLVAERIYCSSQVDEFLSEIQSKGVRFLLVNKDKSNFLERFAATSVQ
jgi:hypothetical protein